MNRKKKLSNKEFIELFDLIWRDSAYVKYQNPNHIEHEHVEMAQKQYRLLFYSA